MKIEYDKLKKIAAEAKAELVMKGQIDLAKGKIRKKPRDPEKEALIFLMANERMKKFKPRKEKEMIVLPYFIQS